MNNQQACLSCPVGEVTASVGSTSAEDCYSTCSIYRVMCPLSNSFILKMLQQIPIIKKHLQPFRPAHSSFEVLLLLMFSDFSEKVGHYLLI